MTSESTRLRESRIPEPHLVSQAERMFRVNWVASELRSPSGVPMHSPDYVSRLGRSTRLVDLRTPEELTGPNGYIPGSDWVPLERAIEVLDAAVGEEEPVVLISRGGERAGDVAKALEKRGKRFVTALMGGVVAWRQVGFSTVRDRAILERPGVLRPAQPTWESARKPLSIEEIRAHVGDPMALRWIKLAALMVNGRLSCVDGRDDSGVMGTPGGDAGEFLLALAALEAVTGQPLSDAEVHRLLLERLDAFGRFYLHTDVTASNALIGAMRKDKRLDAALAHVWEPLEWRRFMLSPPEDVRDVLLEHMIEPTHLGCGHLRLSMQRSADYGARRGLIEAFLRSFLTLRWQGFDENEMVVLPGGHAEGAVVNIVLSEEPEVFSRIPLVSPMAGGSQMFLNHPQVSAYLRAQLVRFLASRATPGGRDAVLSEGLSRELGALGGRQMGHTLGALAGGLPVYQVTFTDDAPSVEAQGSIPAP